MEARFLIDARNEAERVVRATEKSLRDPDLPAIAAADLAPDELAGIEAAISALKSAMRSNDRTLVEQRTAALNEVTKHLAEVMMNRSVKAALAGKNVENV
jgi:molecular chaperone DnaK (HSP70)